MNFKKRHCERPAVVRQSSKLWIASSLMLLAITVLLIRPVYAQEEIVLEAVEEQAPVKDIAAEDKYEERLALARQMHEIWPIRPRIENAINSISENIEQQNRLKFKAAMRQAIKFDALEKASIEAMADIFTAKELEAMIAFYGSKEGRSVSHKTSDYEKALGPLVIQMIDKALLDVKLGAE